MPFKAGPCQGTATRCGYCTGVFHKVSGTGSVSHNYFCTSKLIASQRKVGEFYIRNNTTYIHIYHTACQQPKAREGNESTIATCNNDLTLVVCTLYFEASPFDGHPPTCEGVLPLGFQNMESSLHCISPRGSHHRPTVSCRYNNVCMTVKILPI